MNNSDYRADNVVKHARNYNLDSVLNEICGWSEPKELQRDLLKIYFHASRAVFYDTDNAYVPSDLADAFSTLQNLIEALDEIDNVQTAELQIIRK